MLMTMHVLLAEYAVCWETMLRGCFCISKDITRMTLSRLQQHRNVMRLCRSDTACEDVEGEGDSENDRRTAPTTARQRTRIISSSSDEDENESNDQKVNMTE